MSSLKLFKRKAVKVSRKSFNELVMLMGLKLVGDACLASATRILNKENSFNQMKDLSDFHNIVQWNFEGNFTVKNGLKS